MWRKRIALVLSGLMMLIVSDRIVFARDFPRLPRAITADELARWGDLLGLSDEQRTAVELLFESYLDEFEVVRTQMMEIAVQYPEDSTSDADKTFLQHLPGFVALVRGLDESLLTRIEPLLTDSQRGKLPRVRLLRERALYVNLNATGRFIGTNIADVRDLIEKIVPVNELPEALIPELDAYDLWLTSEIRGVFENAIRLCVHGEDGAAEELVERIRVLRVRNRERCDAFCAMLPAEHARRVRDAFMRHAYDAAVEAASLSILRKLIAAQELPDLNESQRQEVLRLTRETQQTQDEIMEELVALLDQEAINIASPMGAVGGQEYLDQFNKAKQRALKRGVELQTALREAIGEQRMERLKDVWPDRIRTARSWRSACGVTAYISSPPKRKSKPVPFWAGDPLHAPPITVEEMNDYLLALGASREASEQAMGLHQEYAAKLNEQLKQPNEDLARHVFAPSRSGEENGDPMARPRAIEKIRAEIRALVEAADAELFGQLRTLSIAAESETWDAIVRLRQRRMVMLNFIMRGEGIPNQAAEIDIMQLVLRESGGAPLGQAVREVASAYEPRLHELLQRRFEAYARYDFDEQARLDGWQDEFDGSVESWERMIQRTDAIHQLHHDIAAFNSTFIHRFLEVLPPSRQRRCAMDSIGWRIPTRTTTQRTWGRCCTMRLHSKTSPPSSASASANCVRNSSTHTKTCASA